MHRWRKRVKDLRYAAEMLQQTQQPGPEGHGADAHLRRVAKRADDLGEMLGEDHDLAVLAERVRTATKRRGRGRSRKSRPLRRSTRNTLLKLIARRRRKLRKRALRDGERLYRRSAKLFVRRLS
jgi:CHAD domain-containing protein